jgi:2-dehydropantoate 2-reductase
MKWQRLAKQAPVDIAFMCMKSYDTEWATQLIKPYLAPGGYVVSLQNCINEERIAGIVGWGRTLGCIASRISVELFEPGKVRRQAPKGAASHTVFRVGEVHGLPTERAKRVAELLSVVDGSKVTSNLWGERWSKLCHNAMRNGVSAATGLAGREIDQHEDIRHFTIKIGGEAVRVGQALGYELERIGKLDPAKLVLAGDGDAAALKEIDAILIEESAGGARGKLQRPSMGQDMLKGRRTEIEFINGHIVDKGRADWHCRAVQRQDHLSRQARRTPGTADIDRQSSVGVMLERRDFLKRSTAALALGRPRRRPRDPVIGAGLSNATDPHHLSLCGWRRRRRGCPYRRKSI